MKYYKYNFEIACKTFSIITNRRIISENFKYLEIFHTNKKPKFFIHIMCNKSNFLKQSKIKLIRDPHCRNELHTKIYYNSKELKMKETKNSSYLFLKINPYDKKTRRLVRSYIETVVIKRIVSSNSIVFHSSAGAFNKKSVVFLGSCNEGKSTLLKRLVKNNNFTPINEDLNVFIIKNKKIKVYPFFRFQKRNFLISNNSFDLNSLFFIKKSKKTFVRKLKKKEIISFLNARQIYPGSINNLSILIKFAELIKIFELKHKKDENIFECLKPILCKTGSVLKVCKF